MELGDGLSCGGECYTYLPLLCFEFVDAGGGTGACLFQLCQLGVRVHAVTYDLRRLLRDAPTVGGSPGY